MGDVVLGGYSTALGCVVHSLADSIALRMIPSRNAHRFNQNGDWLSKTGQKLQKTRDIWRNSRGSFTSLDYAWTGFGKINHIPTVQIILLPALSAFARHENQPSYVLYQSVPIQRIVSETFI